LTGDASGIDLVRSALLSFTKSMPWYKEALPSSWIELQQNLEKIGTQIEGGGLTWAGRNICNYPLNAG
jgi:hypothetical protein